MPSRLSSILAAGLALATVYAGDVTENSIGISVDDASDCYSGVFTLVARGTFQNEFLDTLDPIATAISAAIPNSTANEVQYLANLQVPLSNFMGVDNAQQQLDNYYSKCPNGKTVLLGYSQGAQCLEIALVGTNLTSPYLEGISSDVGNNIVAVVLFGDLTRVPSQGENAEGAQGCMAPGPLPRTGFYYQEMATYAPRLQEWCHAEDPVCCSTGRNVSAHLDYFSSNTTDSVVAFVKGKFDAAMNSNSTSSSSGAPSSTSGTGSTSATASSAPTSPASTSASSTTSPGPASSTSAHPSTTASKTGAAARPAALSTWFVAGLGVLVILCTAL